MSDTHDENKKDLAFDLIKNPIVAHAQAVKLILACDFFDTRWVGILPERINPLFNPSTYRTIE